MKVSRQNGSKEERCPKRGRTRFRDLAGFKELSNLDRPAMSVTVKSTRDGKTWSHHESDLLADARKFPSFRRRLEFRRVG